MANQSEVISSILKHDRKQNSYKIALVRAINDVVLSYPDIENFGADVAIPLRTLAEFWLAYYWPFADSGRPLLQGVKPQARSDMAFRASLTAFRDLWQTATGLQARPADGFFVINEFRVPRRRDSYDSSLLHAYRSAITVMADAIRQPIQYAGPGNWSVFNRPQRLRDLQNVISIPGARQEDICVIIKAELWVTFRQLSLWVEALCIHEWCLLTERIKQLDGSQLDRGIVYVLLTARPDNRRPLTWERNQIDLLLLEGYVFTCPWTEQRIKPGFAYDLDHLIPVTLYPINELWNLVPANPHFNSHVKSDRLPSTERLQRATPHLAEAYSHYQASPPLAKAIDEDVRLRFSGIIDRPSADVIAEAAIHFIQSVADSRNIARF